MVCTSKQAGQGAWVIGPIRERVLEIGAIREKKHWLRNMKGWRLCRKLREEKIRSTKACLVRSTEQMEVVFSEAGEIEGKRNVFTLNRR